MPKVPTEEQIEFFNREGYLYPVDGISRERCDELLGALDDFEENQGVNAGLFKLKGHLSSPRPGTWCASPGSSMPPRT